MDPHSRNLILLALGAIAVLVLLITRLKMNAFVALLLAALLLGAGAGADLSTVLKSFQDGLGTTLGGIAAVIGLGMMLGKLLAESGGSEVLARRFTAIFGERRAEWCIIALAITIGLTTWFTVGLVLLLPILVTLTRETKTPFVMLAIPLVAFLAVMHNLMPPHPGPVVAVDTLKAQTGLVLLWGFAIGLPSAVVGGPLFARWLARRISLEAPATVAGAGAEHFAGVKPPPFGLTLFSMLLPIGLMLFGTVAELSLPKEHPARSLSAFLGHPTIALTISVLFALWSLGRRCGHNGPQLLKFTEDSIASIGMSLLIVGGGGGFARVLRDAGVADALGHFAQAMGLQPLVYGWLVAAFVRVATGSATVAITTTSGLLAPVVAGLPVNRELLVISIGAGSLFLSHLNDGGFWIVKDCFGLSVGQTLRTWSGVVTITSIAGLIFTLLANFLWQMFCHP